uniref:Zinc-binding dehydrogenase n=1 Tax=Thermofilum pendens TaxID=2269 RepID=A0A7C4B8Z1_THEPE
MLAARLYEPRNLVVEDVEPPKPPAGWAVVRSVAVGICGTDKAFYTGTYPLFKTPLVPGHEVAGIVEEGPEELQGRLVVSEINFSCGKCYYCRSGLYTHCPYKKTLGIDFDGGLAECFVAPPWALHVVEGLDPIVVTEVEPLAAVLNALEQHPLPPTARCAIIGSGNLALLTAQVLRLQGAEPLIVARPSSPKAVKLAGMGFTVASVDEAREAARRSTPEGLGFDVVFEVSGDPAALNLAVELARPRGVIHLKSTPGAPASVNTTLAVVKELRIVGTRCGSFREFERAIELLRRKLVAPIITSVVEGLPRAREAFEKSLSRNEFKVVVKV